MLDDPKLAGEVAAAILRAWADNVSDKPKRKRGRPAYKLNPFNVAIEHELLKARKGMSDNAANENLAEKHDVSVEAIREAIKKKGADARSFLEFFEMPRKPAE
ncbi:hypothetical protein SAHL_12210 [Salinisphaera orenii YIM 95161]|uniref:Uncharacterized protein n=2 Tax=Salinisphaera TaxID=180541 RepID=A0A423PMK8_9GAMM|nr:hypothetical protein SAHL_12210 [Salinisphaera halophila YIM 95161]